MNIKVTTFTNPFSFFCIVDDSKGHYHRVNNALGHHEYDYYQEENEVYQKTKIKDLYHGQYVAVLWNNKWVRGVVSMETQILIWLIDYGIFLRPNEKNYCKDLSVDVKKLPTKVFEASIQGVLPTDKVLLWSLALTEQVEFNNDLTTTWTPGAIKRAQELLQQSEKTYFTPIAILSTQHNDVVLGNLFVELPLKGIVNIIDELLEWPVFLEPNQEGYIKNLSTYYTGRRRHRSCLLKPHIQGFDIPTISFNTTIEEYFATVAKVPTIDTLLFQSNHCINQESYGRDDCSTVVGQEIRDKSTYKITPADIEKYSKRFVTINGKKYNVLTILINKSRDLNMCDRYKDHDLKCIGRGISYRRDFV